MKLLIELLILLEKGSNQFAYDEKLGAYLEMNKAGKETSFEYDQKVHHEIAEEIAEETNCIIKKR